MRHKLNDYPISDTTRPPPDNNRDLVTYKLRIDSLHEDI